MAYNFKDFDAQFPDDAACLHHIFLERFANHVCECGKSGCFHRIAKRRTYCCAWCGAMRGTGTFDVWKNGDGLLKIRIITFDRKSTEYTKHELRIYIPQEGVKLIKRQPAGSTCEFSVFDPLFQKYVRGEA